MYLEGPCLGVQGKSRPSERLVEEAQTPAPPRCVLPPRKRLGFIAAKSISTNSKPILGRKWVVTGLGGLLLSGLGPE